MRVESKLWAARRVGATFPLYRRFLKTLALCALIAVAAATWYLSRPREPAAPAAGLDDERPPSYYLKDAEVLQTDDEGRLLYRIHADYAEERPDDAALVLDGVLFEYRETEQIPWAIRAGRAVLSLDGSAVQLERGVEVTREPGADGRPVVARTEQLVLEPLTHIARAEGEVEFEVGASTLRAVGLELYLKEDRLKLESDVHGRLRR